MLKNLKNSYAEELPELSKRCLPRNFENSKILLRNYKLGNELGFKKDFLDLIIQDLKIEYYLRIY